MRWLILAFTLLALPASAEEAEPPASQLSQDQLYDFAEDFGKCAATYEALSEVSAAEDKDVSEQWRNVSNGAKVASAYMAAQVIPPGRANEFAGNVMESNLPFFRSLLKREDTLDTFKSSLDYCLSLGELQEAIVSHMRKKAYGQSN